MTEGRLPLPLRTRRKTRTSPLLAGPDPEGTLRRLVAERYPVYALADVTVASRDVSKDVMTDEILAALDAHFARTALDAAGSPGEPT